MNFDLGHDEGGYEEVPLNSVRMMRSREIWRKRFTELEEESNMPRDDNGYDPKRHFSPEAQNHLNREEVQEMIEKTAKEAVRQALVENGLISPYENIYAINKPRAWTSDEVADKIVEHCALMANYWATTQGGGSLEDRCHGVAFSILSGLDGSSMNIPAFDLMPAPHDTDKDYHIDQGENYYDPENVVSVALHERYHLIQKKLFPVFNEDLAASRNEMNPQEMREKLAEYVYAIADEAGTSSADKLNACHTTARDILQLFDGGIAPHIPPFMITASPSRELNQMLLKDGHKTWGTHIPVTRHSPAYGADDMLTDAYDDIRRRKAQAGRDFFN